MSTLFDDWALVRPTEMGLVPRVVDMLFQRYRSAVDHRVADGLDVPEAEAEAAAEVREVVLGGRVLGGFVGAAPLAGEMKAFLDSALDVHISDGYGLTEVGAVTRDGIVTRPPVIAYKLVDVPELGYFLTDKPYPRGELLVKTETAFIAGYYKRPEVTSEEFDDEGYYRTGDVMAEIGPDRLVYVDRCNNVMKLAQGEFVAISRLEAVFSALRDPADLHLRQQRTGLLLAVVVPTRYALARLRRRRGVGGEGALRRALQRSAKEGAASTYEVPRDFIIETEPFGAENGLLVRSRQASAPEAQGALRPAAGADVRRAGAASSTNCACSGARGADQPVLETLSRAVQATSVSAISMSGRGRFIDLGGDSLAALTFSPCRRDLRDRGSGRRHHQPRRPISSARGIHRGRAGSGKAAHVRHRARTAAPPRCVPAS